MGEYPTQLKIAKVIAIFKKGQKTQPNNYRQLVYYLVLIKYLKKYCPRA